MQVVPFSDITGKKIAQIDRSDVKDFDKLTFVCADGSVYEMSHSQDCCESVGIEDIAGDLRALVGKEILSAAEASTGDIEIPDGDQRWTFYHLRTMDDTVTIRWYSTSNGYYSIAVDFLKMKEAD